MNGNDDFVVPARIGRHPRPAPTRLAAALAGSIAAHAALLALFALLVGLGARGTGPPFDREPLRATLARPAAVVAVPSPAPPVERTAHAPAVPARATRPLPVPLAAAPKPGPETFEGRVEVLPDEGGAVDAEVERILAAVYPGAQRGSPEFEAAPQPRYPDEARRERRQAFVRVVAVVSEEGAVEVAQGTLDDPLFGPPIREALARARARPPLVDGAPRPLWTVLTFYFESYAPGESTRTPHEK